MQVGGCWIVRYCFIPGSAPQLHRAASSASSAEPTGLSPGLPRLLLASGSADKKVDSLSTAAFVSGGTNMSTISVLRDVAGVRCQLGAGARGRTGVCPCSNPSSSLQSSLPYRLLCAGRPHVFRRGIQQWGYSCIRCRCDSCEFQCVHFHPHAQPPSTIVYKQTVSA
jgi:hypothetical protein